MSFKDKRVSSKAGSKAGQNRTTSAISKIMKKSKDGSLTKADSKNYAKMMNRLYGMEYTDDWLWNRQKKGVKEMKTFNDIRETNRINQLYHWTVMKSMDGKDWVEDETFRSDSQAKKRATAIRKEGDKAKITKVKNK